MSGSDLLHVFAIFWVVQGASEPVTAQQFSRMMVISAESAQEISVSIADTPEGRHSLAKAELEVHESGHLFVFAKEQVRPMQAHSGAPMDVLLVGRDGKIKEVLTSVPPQYTSVSTNSHIAVLKLAAGSAQSRGIESGHQLLVFGLNLEDRPSIRASEGGRARMAEILKRNLADNPLDDGALEALARFHVADGNPSDAISLLESRLDDTGSTALCVVYGIAQLHCGRAEAAAQAFQKAIQIDPTALAPYEQLISLYEKTPMALSKYAEIERSLKETLSSHPLFDEGRILLFRIQLAQNHLADARKTLEAATTLTSELERAFGDLLLREGDYPAAAQRYLLFINARPFHPDVKSLRVFTTVHHPKQKKTEQ